MQWRSKRAASLAGGITTSYLAKSCRFTRGIFVPVEQASAWVYYLITAQVEQGEAQPSIFFWSDGQDVCRTHAIERGKPNLVKIGSQFAKKNFSPLELGFRAVYLAGTPPFSKW